jgi:hypothetical protein
VNVKTKTLTDVESNPLPLLEYDSARIAIIEPSRMIKPIDIAEHCVFCFFQEVIRELVSGGRLRDSWKEGKVAGISLIRRWYLGF